MSKDIIARVLRYKNILEKQGIPVQKLVIFGSYAKKKQRPDSDIDVCVVSPMFGMDSVRDMQFLLKQRRKIDSRIEPIPVSPKDYRDVTSPLIYEIKKFGKEIKG